VSTNNNVRVWNILIGNCIFITKHYSLTFCCNMSQRKILTSLMKLSKTFPTIGLDSQDSGGVSCRFVLFHSIFCSTSSRFSWHLIYRLLADYLLAYVTFPYCCGVWRKSTGINHKYSEYGAFSRVFTIHAVCIQHILLA